MELPYQVGQGLAGGGCNLNHDPDTRQYGIRSVGKEE